MTATPIANQSTHPTRKHGVRPGVEQLEDRTLPTATYLVLDYSNDYNVNASLVNSFNAARFSNGTYPRFLDMDGNGSISLNDVQVCARAVANRVAQIYSPYASEGVHVMYG